MNLNHLKAFVKVVQTGSFKEAARLLSVSQPAITQRIQALEDALKTKLFSKESDGLTSHGKLLYDKATDILLLWDKVEEEILGNKVSGRLVLGCSTIPSEYLIPPILKSYRNHYPDVRLQLRISGTSEVLRWLRERSVDVAITGQPIETGGIFSFPVGEDELQIIAPAESEWAAADTFDKLLDAEWILREPESDTRRCFERLLRHYHVDVSKLHIAGQLESTEAVISAVEAGLGLSTVSSLAARRAEQLGRVQRLFVPEISIQRKFYCSCLQDQQSQSVISSFIHYLGSNRKIQ